MKRRYGSLFGLAMLLASCAADKEPATELFVITDGDGKSLSHLEYLSGTDRMVSATTYDSRQRAIRRTEYEYDSSGNAIRSVTTAPTLEGTETQVKSFTTQEDVDAGGRVTKITRTASDGEVTETFYGYDESGALRGVVQRYADGSLEMMDY